MNYKETEIILPDVSVIHEYGNSHVNETQEEFIKRGEAIIESFFTNPPIPKIVEIGCGAGRVAIPLTQYLGAEESYIGLDVSENIVSWLTDNVTKHYPNFTFKHIDVQNNKYNPDGQPIKNFNLVDIIDGQADLIYAGSVAKHIFPKDLDYYLNQLSLAVRKGGQIYFSCLLVDSDSIISIKEKKAAYDIKKVSNELFVENENAPLNAVAVLSDVLIPKLPMLGFKVKDIIKGDWRSNKTAYMSEDIIIAQKK